MVATQPCLCWGGVACSRCIRKQREMSTGVQLAVCICLFYLVWDFSLWDGAAHTQVGLKYFIS